MWKNGNIYNFLLKQNQKLIQSHIMNIEVLERGFETKLNVLSQLRCLVYLLGKINKMNIFLLFDLIPTKSFLSANCAKKLWLAKESIRK